jgi:hypothetical protein
MWLALTVGILLVALISIGILALRKQPTSGGPGEPYAGL